MKFDIHKAKWIFTPNDYTLSDNCVTIQTMPETDFWQRTYYGFRNNNAPALLVETDEQRFSFLVKTQFDSKQKFDQCGVIIYQDSDNWFKASIEYENADYQRLGSVVTNMGYSDWATADIPATQKYMYYRLSRREDDFCIENSYDAVIFHQMRIFHLFKGAGNIRIGIYACSPQKSSFTATFSHLQFTNCQWLDHQ